MCLSDSSLRMEMWSTLHRGLCLRSPPWCWCCSWPGSGSRSSTSAASESLKKVTPGSFRTLKSVCIHRTLIVAFGGRGVAGRSSLRRSEPPTKWSEMSIGVWGPWVTQNAASWRFSPSWWCCGSHVTRALWTAGLHTYLTPRQSKYEKVQTKVFSLCDLLHLKEVLGPMLIKKKKKSSRICP